MVDREKVIKGLECCIDEAKCTLYCPYWYDNGNCRSNMETDALALLKAQEPRVMTAADFDNNPNMDSQGFLPAWVEYRRDGEWGEYWADDDDEWTSVRADNFEGYGYRCWTSRPTDKQREETPWMT